jgi:hypothetical protein
MPAKKRLIARMAQWAGGVLAVAAVVGALSLLAEWKRWQRHAQARQDEHAQRVEEARAYLADLGKRIDRLPVDANLASEIEARFFEERPRGEQWIWAMDTGGAFSFGVPRSAFEKLNGMYDREVTPRLKEGVFIDRLSFLLSFIDDHGEIQVQATPESAGRLIERGRIPLDRWEPQGAILLSAPLRTAEGAPLGSLYLKRVPVLKGHEDDDRFRATAAAAGVAALASGVFLWILLPTWVYVDARERGVRRAPLFAFLTVLSSFIGLLVYLIARPERKTLACPGCAREVADGAFCPHCGRDLSRSFCPACRYPLQAEWAYCPACRSEVRASPAGAPVGEAT